VCTPIRQKHHHVCPCGITAATPGTCLLSIVANTSNVSYALSVMDAVRVTVRITVSVIRSSALTLVSHLFGLIPPRGSVRLQQ